MKIAVCGKGGSGKSTVVIMLANETRSRGYRVLVRRTREDGQIYLISFN